MGHMKSLMYLCSVSGVECKRTALESQVLVVCLFFCSCTSLDLYLPVFTLTADRYLSNGFPSVSADIVLPLFVILIYRLSFISFHPAIILSQHSCDTGHRTERWGDG